jgi:hypothetical protein
MGVEFPAGNAAEKGVMTSKFSTSLKLMQVSPFELVCCRRRRWKDDYPDSWEPEENVAPDVIAVFEAELEAKRKLLPQGEAGSQKPVRPQKPAPQAVEAKQPVQV